MLGSQYGVPVIFVNCLDFTQLNRRLDLFHLKKGILCSNVPVFAHKIIAMTSIRDFFLFCSGADQSTLEQCPTDTHKYAGIGATVFFTGVLAFFSASYALYTVFDSVLAALVFGTVWGLMIFNLDRYIVMSMKSRGKWWRDLFIALPRVGLAVLLALVISKPLELKIFEKEINGELVQMEQELFKKQEDRVKERFSAEMTDIQTRIQTLKTEIADKTARRDTLALEAMREADGTGGSGKKNLGPIYRAKKLEADQASADLLVTIGAQQPRIDSLETQFRRLEAQQTQSITTLQRGASDGMAARMEALSRLSRESSAIWLASLFITLLFMAIETAPILVKLISTRSPYDYVLHQREFVYEMNHLEYTTTLANTVKNKLKYETETGTHAVQAQITAEKAKIDAKLKETLEGVQQKGYKFDGV